MTKEKVRESIFFAAIRSFFIALFGTAGLIFGIIVVILLIGLFSSTTEGEPDIHYTYTPEIQPNDLGVRKSLSKDAPVVLKIDISGIIGTEALSQQTVTQQLIESRERSLKGDRVKAVLLHINTPGGSAFDADGIYRAIKAYKEAHKVPVYAFVDGLCASGGMYVAAAADKIYASDVSLIGSVGVILSTALNFSQLLDKLGIQSMTLYDGKGKDNLNPLRPWHKGEEDNIKDAIANLYRIFVDVVTENRPNLSKAKLINDYGAKVYPAQLAKEYGFIDENGYSLNKTLKELVEKVSIHDDYYQVIALENKNWLSQLLKGEFGLLNGRVSHYFGDLNTEAHPDLKDQYLYLYRTH